MALLAIGGSSCAADAGDEGDLGDEFASNPGAVSNVAGNQFYVAGGALAARNNLAVTDVAVAVNAIGDPLPGKGGADFDEAAEAFNAEETIEDGVGPVFNEIGCGRCHNAPALGGTAPNIERRYGRITNGTFFGYDRAPENRGGTLRQLFSNQTYTFNGRTCTIPVETEPASANVRNVGRKSIPLFGLGLVDAMPDAVFPQIQATQPAATRGLIRNVTILLPDVRDSSQRSQAPRRSARFGWKGNVGSLTQFSADAYLNEMGITTRSCILGRSNIAFGLENLPDGRPVQAGCNGGDLALAQTDPAIPVDLDDAVEDCNASPDEIQDDVLEFRTFMESLAPPPRDLRDQAAVTTGAQVFDAVGCDDCHVTGTFITPANPFNGVPGRAGFRPFGDLMLHDMGALGDDIGNATGDSAAAARLMRTPPLWGARFQAQFLHDGSAPTIRAAILAHDGTARTARDNFALRISPANQDLLIRFVNSL